ncbi:hypothetical protein Afil01_22550 [Actinorhabdospora filicis]|uniref:Uncharacterized protein n=1 Tax=Actinorhabdospora filicis TaxID=1785913 RepID=A0A9W6SJL3_9ACTN|nr:hypothetical protein [Actinorhabdospora filicis]GLZ77448.1 hypothetical protein Afil01_22550 [Actinorhabdospora filicis]
MVDSAHREFVRAHILGETDRAEAILARIPAEQEKDYHLFLSALVKLLLDLRFGEGDMTYRDITGLVAELEDDHRNDTHPVEPFAVEGYLRALNGEERFFTEIPLGEQVRAQFLIMSKIATQAPDVIPNVDEYLTRAEAEYLRMVKDAEG